jgi:4-alpha-glucanotransferase
VSFDSVDVWSNPDIFMLDKETGLRNDVAGVPPDYFSPTGQLWGNPLYRWFGTDGSLKDETVDWWIKRIKRAFSFCDIVRIDHFRAFESFWAVPSHETTAVHGNWMKGPGLDLFDRIRKELGDLPLIAEDLGIINKEVEDLRDNTGLPGMKILQFAFDGSPDNHYLPYNILQSNSVVYTGTHDNDTSAGWYHSSDVSRKKFVRNVLNLPDDRDFTLRFVALAYSSIADLCIIPMQDIIGLGSSARMNTPGSMTGNWIWRLTIDELNAAPKIELRALVHIYNRLVDDTGEKNIIRRYFS